MPFVIILEAESHSKAAADSGFVCLFLMRGPLLTAVALFSVCMTLPRWTHMKMLCSLFYRAVDSIRLEPHLKVND